MGSKGRTCWYGCCRCFSSGRSSGLAWSQDHDFWRSKHSLYRGPRRPRPRATRARALELARKAWTRDPRQIRSSGFFWAGFISMPAREGGAGDFPPDDGAQDPGPRPLMIHAQALERLGETQEALDTLAWYLQRQPDDRSILRAAAAHRRPSREVLSPGGHVLSAALRLGPRPPGAAAAGETAGVAKSV